MIRVRGLVSTHKLMMKTKRLRTTLPSNWFLLGLCSLSNIFRQRKRAKGVCGGDKLVH